MNTNSKGQPSKFRISLVNHPDFNNPEHWDTNCSVREARAIRRARLLIKQGHRDVMLFKEVSRNGEKQMVRISLKPRALDPSKYWANFNPDLPTQVRPFRDDRGRIEKVKDRKREISLDDRDPDTGETVGEVLVDLIRARLLRETMAKPDANA